MTKTEWYQVLGRCMKALKLHPCQLLLQWDTLDAYFNRRRREGASPYEVAAELWPK